MAVRELVHELIAEGITATVPADVRETVDAVCRVTAAKDGLPASITEITENLGLDKSATSRRVKKAKQLGFLKDDAPRRPGQPARIVAGDPLPEDAEILPSIEAVERAFLARRFARGARPSPSEVKSEMVAGA